MSQEARWYAVRQFRSGAVRGSRLMSEEDAAREVAAWREQIGPAAMVPDSPQARQAVRRDDSPALFALLLEHEPRVWVSTTSHRSRDRLRVAMRLGDGGELHEYGAWSRPGARRIASGAYYQVPARLAAEVASIKGVRVLVKPPARLFKCWTAEDTGGPELGSWPVPAETSS
jgi:hypothetical protein